MLPYKGCAYRRTIPGNCHIRCVFDWSQEPELVKQFQAENQVSDHVRQWFAFPFNYDPVWGADECPARSETLDDAKVEKPNPLKDLLSMLSR